MDAGRGRTRRALAPAALLAALLTAAVAPALPAAAEPPPRAVGGGTVTEGGEKSTIAFAAVQRRDGTVAGRLVYRWRAGDASVRVRVDCLDVAGNRAVLGGRVEEVTGEVPPFITEGLAVVIQVEDNGEGAGAPPDRVSDLLFLVFNRTGDCHTLGPETPPRHPLGGNVDVRP